MARKSLVALCFLVAFYEVHGFLIPKEKTAAPARAEVIQNTINAEILANEEKISNMTRQLSDDYKKYSYLITTYL